MVAGGMESMSNVPFLVGRDPPKYGGHTMEVGRAMLQKLQVYVVINHFCLMAQSDVSFGTPLENVTGPKRFSGATSMTQLMVFSMYQYFMVM